MLISEQKPFEEIMQYLDGEKNVFIVGCKGCAEGCETGGEREVMEMRQKLEEAGRTVTGVSLIDFVCNDQLTKMTLRAHEGKIVASDSLLVLCCGAGIQAVASVVDKVVHPGCNTISLGGRHSEWREGEFCLECGQCVLEFTGGICPIARCPKTLVNGSCGGYRDGMCEVNPDRDCAWVQIFQRLEKLGQKEKLKNMPLLKDYSRSYHARHIALTPTG